MKFIRRNVCERENEEGVRKSQIDCDASLTPSEGERFWKEGTWGESVLYLQYICKESSPWSQEVLE